jgi:hypothetical protein
MTELFAAVGRGIADSGLSRRLQLGRVRRREYRRIQRELMSYTDRELLADLRRTRSEVEDIALEGAERAVAAFVAAHPDYRQAAAGWQDQRRGTGFFAGS